VRRGHAVVPQGEAGRRLLRATIFALIAIAVGHATIATASQPCNASFWVWQGGERVKVCCNQQGFCFTKYGIYNQ